MDRVLPWFRLKHVPGVGNLLFKRLLEAFQSPEAVFEASVDALSSVDGITPKTAHAIRTSRISDDIRRDIDLVDQHNIRIVTFRDTDYPSLLRQLPDPPPFLYVRGKLDDRIDNIAVVGSRNATHYGLASAARLSRDLVACGLRIVSGMAKGIDTAAHQGALEGNGSTFAVLGSGLLVVYPADNQALYDRISENGAVISEFPMRTEPNSHHFPIRNRVISGMCLGTVVVEATRRSGSLITARLAAEQNREVFAVPGSIQSFKSTGTHALLKEGAKLVENAMDVMEEIRPLQNQPTVPDETLSRPRVELSPDEEEVVNVLEPYPLHIDTIARKINMESGKLASLLLQLELSGLIDQLPGKRFTLKEDSSCQNH